MTLRTDWTLDEIAAIYNQPFADLLYQAQTVHRENFKANSVQAVTLLNIKTGACPEDCAYCTQSGHFKTKLKTEKLWNVEDVLTKAREAKENGAMRFCMGAAWRSIPKKDRPQIETMIREVKALGLETCMTLGMLDQEDAEALKSAGLDYYNHNLDTSPDYYKKIITTRTYQDRLDTLEHVRNANMKVCCGGIVGMGETREDRIAFLQQLANLPKHPESVTLNQLMPMQGTPLEKVKAIEPFEYVRVVATARILMPQAYVRLSAGRNTMNRELQTLCLLAGGNSIFYGEKLLTADNPSVDEDKAFLANLGMIAEESCML
jgi:biotin synthase